MPEGPGGEQSLGDPAPSLHICVFPVDRTLQYTEFGSIGTLSTYVVNELGATNLSQNGLITLSDLEGGYAEIEESGDGYIEFDLTLQCRDTLEIRHRVGVDYDAPASIIINGVSEDLAQSLTPVTETFELPAGTSTIRIAHWDDGDYLRIYRLAYGTAGHIFHLKELAPAVSLEVALGDATTDEQTSESDLAPSLATQAGVHTPSGAISLLDTALSAALEIEPRNATGTTSESSLAPSLAAQTNTGNPTSTLSVLAPSLGLSYSVHDTADIRLSGLAEALQVLLDAEQATSTTREPTGPTTVQVDLGQPTKVETLRNTAPSLALETDLGDATKVTSELAPAPSLAVQTTPSNATGAKSQTAAASGIATQVVVYAPAGFESIVQATDDVTLSYSVHDGTAVLNTVGFAPSATLRIALGTACVAQVSRVEQQSLEANLPSPLETIVELAPDLDLTLNPRAPSGRLQTADSVVAPGVTLILDFGATSSIDLIDQAGHLQLEYELGNATSADATIDQAPSVQIQVEKQATTENIVLVVGPTDIALGLHEATSRRNASAPSLSLAASPQDPLESIAERVSGAQIVIALGAPGISQTDSLGDLADSLDLQVDLHAPSAVQTLTALAPSLALAISAQTATEARSCPVPSQTVSVQPVAPTERFDTVGHAPAVQVQVGHEAITANQTGQTNSLNVEHREWDASYNLSEVTEAVPVSLVLHKPSGLLNTTDAATAPRQRVEIEVATPTTSRVAQAPSIQLSLSTEDADGQFTAQASSTNVQVVLGTATTEQQDLLGGLAPSLQVEVEAGTATGCIHISDSAEALVVQVAPQAGAAGAEQVSGAAPSVAVQLTTNDATASLAITDPAGSVQAEINLGGLPEPTVNQSGQAPSLDLETELFLGPLKEQTRSLKLELDLHQQKERFRIRVEPATATITLGVPTGVLASSLSVPIPDLGLGLDLPPPYFVQAGRFGRMETGKTMVVVPDTNGIITLLPPLNAREGHIWGATLHGDTDAEVRFDPDTLGAPSNLTTYKLRKQDDSVWFYRANGRIKIWGDSASQHA